ncbi:putative Acyl-CoA N-acyltransferase [Vibrio nigripulchritudo SO65]|uniref:GNAT family N-acetyltransferase n=1 Tax=Vibrio nigripulchritudo TaxID=28173 RepID=UPI0003B2448A|nr:GNAT family N-acetyltransferase [Vibrio nigripulchritudo]CCN33758.1 putative Acyl-CoA N-acyltransferase [Vibrio nigripulchritudo AM115]CCN41960.1 putative Acyl-CoA N-acyltransferase [Vibrio nigripulchritudo FTn2]CCN66248.1 putative Acyl-CoA N-acyltransferase [Vibrio nigripulchritudo POn4]CCN74606.1 putative Acyl-CoA N-acyltransferase [Vibrio nigripulchritudo SO65]
MKVVPLYSHSPGVPEIIQDIDHLMNSLYPAESNDLLPLDKLDDDNVYFAGIYDGDVLSACGAVVFKKDNDEYGEFKRIYVKPEFRGKDQAKRVLRHLIDATSNRSVSVLRLETGNKQHAAIKLYESLGFRERNEFGDYQSDPHSVYMELLLNR